MQPNTSLNLMPAIKGDKQQAGALWKTSLVQATTDYDWSGFREMGAEHPDTSTAKAICPGLRPHPPGTRASSSSSSKVTIEQQKYQVHSTTNISTIKICFVAALHALLLLPMLLLKLKLDRTCHTFDMHVWTAHRNHHTRTMILTSPHATSTN